MKKNKNLLSVSGKKGSGKDTFARIVNIIVSNPHFTDEAVVRFIPRHHNNNFKYKYKAFAEKLKIMVSLLTGYTLEELEDREIKEKELGEEWWRHKLHDGSVFRNISKEEYDSLPDSVKNSDACFIEKLTLRKLLQLLGTECGRNIIHPDVWINALMSGYKEYKYAESADGKVVDKPLYKYPNWFITDVRFPDEMKAIQDRKGIVVRLERPDIITNAKTGQSFPVKVRRNEHISETALDHCKDFDYTIQNDGSLLDLVVDARKFIKEFKLLEDEV